MENIEIFKDIKDYEGLYQISNLGNIKSFPKLIKRGKGYYLSNEKILKLKKGKTNYYKVNLYKDGICKTFQVHQLVAVAFLNHIPCGFNLVVNHKDFDTYNNNVENLEIVTNRENSNQKHLKSYSKYTGVSWYKKSKKWGSRIRFNGKLIHLGSFDTEENASLFYENALISIQNNTNIIKATKHRNP